jgi:hypothetical protein
MGMAENGQRATECSEIHELQLTTWRDQERCFEVAPSTSLKVFDRTEGNRSANSANGREWGEGSAADRADVAEGVKKGRHRWMRMNMDGDTWMSIRLSIVQGWYCRTVEMKGGSHVLNVFGYLALRAAPRTRDG